MFYGVENKENMIAGVIGYDSIRKHLAECGYHTAEIREKCHPYGCVHRYKDTFKGLVREGPEE